MSLSLPRPRADRSPVSICALASRLARHVLEHQRVALRSERGWWKHLSAFEYAKLITLERALVFFGYHRAKASEPSHLPIPANFGRIGLPFNIFEAVLQDAVFYRQPANAWAGVPLILARPGRAGRPAALSPDSRRAVRMHLPQPDAWKVSTSHRMAAFGTSASIGVPTSLAPWPFIPHCG